MSSETGSVIDSLIQSALKRAEIDESAAVSSSSTSAEILSANGRLDLRRNWIRRFLDFRPRVRIL